MQNAELIFRPVVMIRAERVAEVLGCGIEQANKLLSQPDTRDIIQAALNQSFQETVDRITREMLRVPLVSVPGPRVDCAVALPQLPEMVSRVG